MSMKLVKRVPTGEEIKELYPLSQELKDIKAKRDESHINLLTYQTPYSDPADVTSLCIHHPLFLVCSYIYVELQEFYL